MLLPGESTTLLRIVAFLFVSGGMVLLAATAILVVGKAAGWRGADEVRVPLLLSLFNVLLGAGHVWTGILLHQGRRLGGYVAVTVLALSLLLHALSPSPARWGDLVIPVLSLLALLAAWGHLTPDGLDPEAPVTGSSPRGG